MNPQKQKDHGQAALAGVLVLVSVVALVGVSAAQDAEVNSPITVSQLAGRWQLAVVGNTGCGISSLLFTGTMNSSGTARGTLIGSSGCGPSSNTQTFSIISLSPNGSGTAGLTCGPSCGWIFKIQVSPNLQVMNLVDVTDLHQWLAGTAVK